MPEQRCNCENKHCHVCQGLGCWVPAGNRKALYVGALCNGCAEQMPAKYMLPDKEETK